MSVVHRGLDVETVVRASLAIADAEGLERLSMRRLASALDVTPMAIYHHVDNKDQLLDLLADESLKALPDVDVDAAWREELQRVFLAFHRLYLAHPSLAFISAQRPMEGPTAVAVAEQLLTLLIKGGLDDGEAAAALVTLYSFTIGSSLYRLSRSQQAGDRRPRLVAISEEMAPTAYRLRQEMADAAANEDHFLGGLTRLIESYGPRRRRRASGRTASAQSGR